MNHYLSGNLGIMQHLLLLKSATENILKEQFKSSYQPGWTLSFYGCVFIHALVTIAARAFLSLCRRTLDKTFRGGVEAYCSSCLYCGAPD